MPGGLLALLWGLLLPGSQDALRLMQERVVVGQVGSSASLSCRSSSSVGYMHWYRQQEGRGPQRLLRLKMQNSEVYSDAVLETGKVTTVMNSKGYSCSLVLRRLESTDQGIYYCASWTTHSAPHSPGPCAESSDRLDGDFSPKPTIFLPSPAEINLHKTGTHLCLFENFFPDVIKIDWKEENSDTVLNSQQGETMKTGNTYMKFSWLTVTGQSMDKIHKCIVKHEFNRRGVDQEILFPSVKEVKQHLSNTYFEASTIVGAITTAEKHGYTTPIVIKDESEPLKEVNDILQLQRSNTSAYYIYILLLLKSLIYFTCTIFYLFWRKPACSNRKFS